MGSLPDPGELTHPPPPPPPSFDEFQRQTSLMTSCTLLWKELSDHFSSLEQDLIKKSDALKAKFQALNNETQQSLQALDTRESSISKSMSIVLESLEKTTKRSVSLAAPGAESQTEEPEVDDSEGLLMKLKSFCHKMAAKEFWVFVTARKKELELFRSELPKALADCVIHRDLFWKRSPRFFLSRAVTVLVIVPIWGWACVLLLESLIPVMVDPVLGKERMLVTPSIKGRAEEIAETWKKSLEERGGIENVKTPDVHTFLQHLVTFGIVKEEDVDLYRKLVVASAWRKQMPKLAVSLGLGDKMPDMIEELIGRGQQVDAVHFTYEVGLADKFPPVPLLKAFLKDAKKAATSILEDPNNSGRAAHMAAKKEQSAIRAVLKCIEEYKLEAEFPPENLKKRLEQLEKAKIEKKKPASPAAKRTRASNGGPMPCQSRSFNKCLRLIFPISSNICQVSFTHPVPRSRPSIPSRSCCLRARKQESSLCLLPRSSPPAIVGSYPVSPVNFPAYGGYNSGMAPAYQQPYY
ncbi:UNVERIFIED_CONTAM: FRIGIDA-like protein 4a [Sesamum radiatum]|uniref:FRIGIDA-like protein n=1 Tax=Sesamum radiatum TaxID=300843 RepID=A0AAW2SKK9_SESRA